MDKIFDTFIENTRTKNKEVNEYPILNYNRETIAVLSIVYL